MKKNLLKIITLVAAIGMLASCEIHFGPSSNSNVISAGLTAGSISKSEGEGFELVDPKYTMRQNSENAGWNTLNSTGDQKILVVPVKLSGESSWTQTKLDNVNKVFFGEASDTSWQSVKSFFETSSYGNLHITGEVLPEFSSSYSYASLMAKGQSSSDAIAEEFNAKTTLTNDQRKAYDQDGDGYLDAVVFLYQPVPTDSNSDSFWAWCFATELSASKLKPAVNNYMWASYDFINDTYTKDTVFGKVPSGLEAHTYIHETGHLLGLDDYYSYDDSSTSKPWDCAGDREMQSFNIGDHNIYSKMALGWVDPYYVTGSCEIKLHTSALYGEAILIKDDWNKSIFDEYLMIEYYTPNGLNKQDSQYSYDSRNKMYEGSGLRIYHIDARLVKGIYVSGSSYSNRGYSSDWVKNNTIIGASNSLNRSYLTSTQAKNGKVRYVHLLDSGKNNTLSNGVNGTGDYSSITVSKSQGLKINPDKTLWTKGQTFEATSDFFANGTKFNDGTALNYTITVGETDGDAITVKITKN